MEADRQQENGFIRGRVGGGAAIVKLNTTYGNITLRKTEVDPARAESTPPPPQETTPKERAPASPPGVTENARIPQTAETRNDGLIPLRTGSAPTRSFAEPALVPR